MEREKSGRQKPLYGCVRKKKSIAAGAVLLRQLATSQKTRYANGQLSFPELLPNRFQQKGFIETMTF